MLLRTNGINQSFPILLPVYYDFSHRLGQKSIGISNKPARSGVIVKSGVRQMNQAFSCPSTSSGRTVCYFALSFDRTLLSEVEACRELVERGSPRTAE